MKYFQLNYYCFFALILARSEYNDYAEFRKTLNKWNDFIIVQFKIDSSENKFDYVIVDEMLSKIITRRTNDVSNIFLNERQYWFSIHHFDFNVDNIFIDENFNITCIIDWMFCFSVFLFIFFIVFDLSQSRHEIDISFLLAFENEF